LITSLPVNSMNDRLLDDLGALVMRHTVPDGRTVFPMPGVVLMASDRPTPPMVEMTEPMLAVVIQGGKCVCLGETVYDYRAGQYLVVSIDLPLQAHVSVADSDAIYLGLGFSLRPEVIASLLLDMETPYSTRRAKPGIGVSDLSEDLVEALIRLVRLVERPDDVPVLAASIEREIIWRLLNGPQGGLVRQMGLADSRIAQVNRAIRWIRKHYNEPLCVSELARVADMSVTSFHRHFRSITSMSPLQYQKHLRLQTARSQLRTTADDVAVVGFTVGYESTSQFSREYRRMFGLSPGRDGRQLRIGGAS
jgi:AraC-like DNA-binding protein